MRNRSLGIDLLLFRQNEFKNKDCMLRESSFSWMKGRGAARQPDLIHLIIPPFDILGGFVEDWTTSARLAHETVDHRRRFRKVG